MRNTKATAMRHNGRRTGRGGTFPTVLALLALMSVRAEAQPAAAPSPSAALAVERLTVRVENPLEQARVDEVISVPWLTLSARLPGLTAGRVRVLEAGGEEAPIQVLDADGDGAPDELLILASFWPGQTRSFSVEAAPPERAAEPRAYAVHHPGRDDVAWESDRMAFRTYGRGLWELEDLVSSGNDVWLKRTRELIIDRWYAAGQHHTDSGEGADFFSVGPTLGAGGTAVWVGGTLHRSPNFTGHRIVAAGPIRAVVELEYAPWQAGDVEVSEVRRITIDAGRHVFRQESSFHSAEADTVAYAIGLVGRDGFVASFRSDMPWAWLSGWGPVERKYGGHGDLGTAVLAERDGLSGVRTVDGHYVFIADAPVGQPVVHYVGAGWTASGEFDRAEDWFSHLDAVARGLAAPLRVTVVDEED